MFILMHVSMMHASLMHASLMHVSLMHISMMLVSMMLVSTDHDGCIHDAFSMLLVAMMHVHDARFKMLVSMMHVWCRYIYDPRSWCMHVWCRYEWCLYPWSLTMKHVSLMRYFLVTDGRTNGRTDGQGDSRSWKAKCSAELNMWCQHARRMPWFYWGLNWNQFDNSRWADAPLGKTKYKILNTKLDSVW